MQTQITSRHFHASPELKNYASERITKLERYYDGITDVRVILGYDRGHSDDKYAEISLNVYRFHLSAQDTATSYEEAIDHCVDRLRRQILKYKAKLRNNTKKARRA